ncbi:UNKNOWN [Stylonychia lemnae]|uniref:Uncharacterized protein n=1 Tax=Stylonychia lemnae TaxID=5949 RepID=A0A077ZN23_STYLE|nr:UNKNOWN [Stylonychia lemnae]|eukprot:CDW71372.1 UNKNOWN [Stylonychia lemnae]
MSIQVLLKDQSDSLELVGSTKQPLKDFISVDLKDKKGQYFLNFNGRSAGYIIVETKYLDQAQSITQSHQKIEPISIKPSIMTLKVKNCQLQLANLEASFKSLIVQIQLVNNLNENLSFKLISENNQIIGSAQYSLQEIYKTSQKSQDFAINLSNDKTNQHLMIEAEISFKHQKQLSIENHNKSGDLTLKVEYFTLDQSSQPKYYAKILIQSDENQIETQEIQANAVSDLQQLVYIRSLSETLQIILVDSQDEYQTFGHLEIKACALVENQQDLYSLVNEIGQESGKIFIQATFIERIKLVKIEQPMKSNVKKIIKNTQETLFETATSFPTRCFQNKNTQRSNSLQEINLINNLRKVKAKLKNRFNQTVTLLPFVFFDKPMKKTPDNMFRQRNAQETQSRTHLDSMYSPIKERDWDHHFHKMKSKDNERMHPHFREFFDKPINYSPKNEDIKVPEPGENYMRMTHRKFNNTMLYMGSSKKNLSTDRSGKNMLTLYNQSQESMQNLSFGPVLQTQSSNTMIQFKDRDTKVLNKYGKNTLNHNQRRYM